MATSEPSSAPAGAFPGGNFLQNPALLANPYPLYAMLRKNSPVLRLPIPNHEGAGAWLLTRYEDVQRVLKDGSFSVDRLRADLVRENRERLPVGLLGAAGGFRSMLIMDPPDHTRVRGLVNKAFTPRRVAALRPHIEQVVTELLDVVEESGRMEVIHDLAEPLPAIVIAELLGVPPENHRQFRKWSSYLISQLQPGNLDAIANVEGALQPILDYLREHIAQRRRAPQGDLISAMIEAQEARDALSDDELLATSNLILLAGHETTTNLIGNGLLALLRHPGQLERLRAEPGLLKTAIEELLRYDSPVQATVRVPIEDVTIREHTLQAGAVVVCGIGAANRDPELFPDPDRLDVARSDVHHLSFGFGAHFCLGATLARLEAEIAFAALLSRFPRLRLENDKEDVAWRPNPLLRGLKALPDAF